jgi:hypothetical protein
MKKIIYYLIGLFIVGGVATSCKDIDSTFKEFVVPGGIVYPERALNAVAYSGKDRVLLKWAVGVDPSVIKARISWNNYTDSVDIDIPAGTDTITYIVDSLGDNTYSFIIRTFDKVGNVSIPVEVLGTSYGTEYQNSLLNVPIISSNWLQNDTLSTTCGVVNKTDGIIATDIMYMSTTGDSVKVRNNLVSTNLVNKYPNYKGRTNFYLRTLYKPDSTAIDTFYTDYKLIGEVHPIPIIQNGSFESPHISGYSQSITIDNWTGTASFGIGANGSAYGQPNAPDGTQAALMQKVGTITQTLNCNGITGTYKLTFQASQRKAGNVQVLTIYFDNTLIGTFTPTNAYQQFTSDPFTVTGGIHTISISGTNGTGDNTAFVDVVKIVEVN